MYPPFAISSMCVTKSVSSFGSAQLSCSSALPNLFAAMDQLNVRQDFQGLAVKIWRINATKERAMTHKYNNRSVSIVSHRWM